MSAQAIPPKRRRWPGPALHRQRAADHTVDDVLALPDDAPRVELNDGVLCVVPSPSGGHQEIGNLLWWWLRQHAPAGHRPLTAVGVLITLKDTLEPDLALLREPVMLGEHYYDAAQVAVAVEVVSPGTRRRDRLEKPADYAAAGIRHYWRIEQNPVHVFAYELAGDSYKLIADSADELVLERPFPIRLPIRDITP